MKRATTVILCYLMAFYFMSAFGGDLAINVTLNTTAGGQLKDLLRVRKYFVEDLTIKGVLSDEDYEVLWEASYYGKLKTLNLREVETNIPAYAFYHPDIQGTDPTNKDFKPIKLQKLILPPLVNTIAMYAFYGAPLESVNWEETTVYWVYDYSFSYTPLKSVILPHSDFVVGSYAFAYSGVEYVYVNHPYVLSNSAFEGCKNLKSVNMPITFRHYEKIFFDCDIQEVLFNPSYPEATYRISKQCFGNNKNLHNIKFNIECMVDADAFDGCNVETIIFDAPMLLLSDSFRNLSTLKQIYCTSQEPPRAYEEYGIISYHIDYYEPFGGTTPKDVTVYVPVGCADAYRNAQGWNYFTNFVETDNFPTGADMIFGSETSGKVAVPVSGGIRLCPDKTGSYSVYSLGGIMIASGHVEAGTEQTILCEPGMYVVRIEDKSEKVKVD